MEGGEEMNGRGEGKKGIKRREESRKETGGIKIKDKM